MAILLRMIAYLLQFPTLALEGSAKRSSPRITLMMIAKLT
jgi:hypothetical protein